MSPLWVVLNCVGELRGLGTLSPEKCTDSRNVLYHFRGLGQWVKYLWEAPGTLASLPILYFHEVHPQGR